MKTDEEFVAAWSRGDRMVRETADILRRMGLTVEITKATLRSHVSEHESWAHDVDLYIEGLPYQHKENKRYAWGERQWSLVDERIKADRTPVAAYIITFTCGRRMVTPYAPDRWQRMWLDDRFDRSRKEFYTCPKREFQSLDHWFFGQRGLF